MPSGVYKRTPEHNAANSKSKKGVPKSLEHIAAMSVGIRNSDAVKAANEAKTGVPLSSEHCDAISAAQRGVPKSPEHCVAISKGKKSVPQTPEHSAAALIAREEAGVYDAQRGGYDTVKHHYIYDHSDLSLNTIQMTRSDHMKLHRLLQKLSYIVPHINIKEI